MPVIPKQSKMHFSVEFCFRSKIDKLDQTQSFFTLISVGVCVTVVKDVFVFIAGKTGKSSVPIFNANGFPNRDSS